MNKGREKGEGLGRVLWGGVVLGNYSGVVVLSRWLCVWCRFLRFLMRANAPVLLCSYVYCLDAASLQ